MEPVLKVEEIFKEFSEKGEIFSVLNGISFTINNSEMVAVMGPSGAGKTTLLNILSGLDTPTSGRVILGQYDVHKVDDDTAAVIRRKNLGLVFQEFYLLPSLTAYENVEVPLLFDGTSENQRGTAIIDALEHVGMTDKENFYPSELSGGEKQRIAIARAFLTDPEILILDDSVSAVDSETEEKITNALDNITQNRTTIIITHRLHTIRSSDKIIVLKSGNSVAEGQHDELIQWSEDYRRIFGKHLFLPELQVK